MSVGILEKVKEFLVKLVKDETFRTQLENTAVEARTQFLADAGYNFSKEEFESAAIQVLEEKEQGQFNDLSETELATVFGGFVGTAPIVQPMYGVIWWPIRPIKPLPPIQPLYGVIVSTNQ
ncbi:MAG: Nif11-like leader peptide family natural product precursor [Leptolyngbyaceae cyanobacterium HOT.MB2.61]|jgi:predicted ribosomally synthesized peptide with nif11-like leader|nr:Nif11-like leader peptide family natural product precursor [Leptolyngbyaceae cyanobacterium HOT.MB2.61]